MGVKVPQPADDANAPPLFTAIQEQFGLKLEAQKVDASVILVGHVEHPSPN
jgi:bla regulator protein blaR1